MISLILFLDRHLWLYRSLCGGLLAMTGWLALQPQLRPGARSRQGWGHPGLFLLALVVSLFAWRYPIFFYPRCVAIDEAQMLTQAITLRVHPIPWLDMDGTTGGPLNSYVLLWCVPFGIDPTYLTTRICGLLCVAGMLIFLYLAARRLAGEALARFAILPVFLFFTLTSLFDWVHYTSEHLSLLLFAASLYLLTGLWRRPEGPGRTFLLGLLLGLLPFAKLQSSLGALFLGVMGILAVTGRGHLRFGGDWRRVLPLAAGALLPAIVILSVVAKAGALYDFWQSYIRMGMWMTEDKGSPWLNFFIRMRLATSMILNPRLESAFPVYLTGIVAVFAALRVRTGTALSPALRRNLLLVVPFTGIMIWTVMAPGRFFQHYILYMMVALPLLLAVSLRLVARDLRLRREGGAPEVLPAVRAALWFVGCLAMLGLTLLVKWPVPFGGAEPLFVPTRGPVPYVVFPLIGLGLFLFIDAYFLGRRGPDPLKERPAMGKRLAVLTYFVPFYLLSALALACFPNIYLGKIAAFRATPLPPIDQAILQLRPPGGTVVVWGYQPDYTAETASVLGTRDSHGFMTILPGPLHDYYQARFLRDMEASRPAIFIDAVTPRNFFFRDPVHQGMESFAELAAYVAREYRQVREIDGMRLFLRRDLPAGSPE